MSRFERILIGIVLFYSGNLFGDSGWIPKIIIKPFVLLGLLMVIYNYIYIRKQNPFKGVEKYVFYVYILYSLWVVIWGSIHAVGISFYDFLLTNRIWWFFAPLFVLLPFTEKNIALLFKWTFIQTLIALLFIFLNWSEITDVFNASVPFSMIFSMMAFLGYLFKFKKKYTYIILFTYLLSLYAPLIAGRRTAVSLLLFFPMAYGLVINVINFKPKYILLVLPFMFLFFLFWSDFFDWFVNLFPIMSERLLTDNRSNLDIVFLEQLSVFDLIFGRGLTGNYVIPMDWNNINIRRSLIENAYLNIILKGGLMLLVPYVFLLVKSVYKCVSCYKNQFSMFSAIYIIGILLSMISLMPTLSLGTFILWFFIKGNSMNNIRTNINFGYIERMRNFLKYVRK